MTSSDLVEQTVFIAAKVEKHQRSDTKKLITNEDVQVYVLRCKAQNFAEGKRAERDIIRWRKGMKKNIPTHSHFRRLNWFVSYLSNNFSLREGFFFFSSTSLLRLEGDDNVTGRNGVYQVFVGRFLLRLDIDNNGWHIRSQENPTVRS